MCEEVASLLSVLITDSVLSPWYLGHRSVSALVSHMQTSASSKIFGKLFLSINSDFTVWEFSITVTIHTKQVGSNISYKVKLKYLFKEVRSVAVQI